MPQRKRQGPQDADTAAAAAVDKNAEHDKSDKSDKSEKGENGGTSVGGRGRARPHAVMGVLGGERAAEGMAEGMAEGGGENLRALKARLNPQQPAKRLPQINTLLRRQNVLMLWSRGYSVREIADTLGADGATVRNDIRELQRDLQRDILPELQSRVNRAAATRQAIIQEAWSVYHALDANQHNKVSALKMVLEAADSLDKLTGVAAPEQINATVVAEMQETVMAALYKVGGQELQQVFLRQLRAQATKASDFYPPDPLLPGEKQPLDEFLAPPDDYDGYVESDPTE